MPRPDGAGRRGPLISFGDLATRYALVEAIAGTLVTGRLDAVFSSLVGRRAGPDAGRAPSL
jgi:hypothetical protein